MRLFAMIAKALAVIGGDRDDRLSLRTELSQSAEHTADLIVHERHLAVVGRRHLALPRLRRIVARVRIEVVNPQKPRRQSARR